MYPIKILALIPLLLLMDGALAQSVDLLVTQSNLNATVCSPGYTDLVRPSSSFIRRARRELSARTPTDPAKKYVVDHIVPLSVGGSPADMRNLALQERSESVLKDRVENRVHHQLCNGTRSLRSAQRCFSEWRACQ